jgi:hypothetical protein
MRKITLMLLGSALLFTGCSRAQKARDAAQSGSGAPPGSEERLVSTKITNATWDHILEGPATLTAVRQSCKEGQLSMYVATSSVCPATKPEGAKEVSGSNMFSLQQGEHLCAAVGGGEGPCTLMFQQSKETQ